MGFKFGKRSKERLDTCHPDLIKIMEIVISRSNVDFGISEGHRTVERQNELFNQGKSKIDGINVLGKHNHKPSLAVDIYTYHPDLETRKKIAYDKVHLAYISGLVQSVAEELYKKGEISHGIRWGANWDNDNIIDFDQSFDDYPHFELRQR
jgi:peptidoglycan L-alanyl-D-glutamate endopeptidase CwlK